MLEENLGQATFSLKNLTAKVKNAVEKEIPNEFRGVNYKMDSSERDLKEWKFKVTTQFEEIDNKAKE